MFKKGVPLGTGQYGYTAQNNDAYNKARTSLNIDESYRGRQ
jgi:hypothetical protein